MGQGEVKFLLSRLQVLELTPCTLLRLVGSSVPPGHPLSLLGKYRV